VIAVTYGRSAGDPAASSSDGRHPGPKPADLATAYAILDSFTGSRSATLAMLNGSRWPGAELATPSLVPQQAAPIEMPAAEADLAVMSQKMANSIDVNKKLQETYLPDNATLVRLADAARAKGRARATREAAKRGGE